MSHRVSHTQTNKPTNRPTSQPTKEQKQVHGSDDCLWAKGQIVLTALQQGRPRACRRTAHHGSVAFKYLVDVASQGRCVGEHVNVNMRSFDESA